MQASEFIENLYGPEFPGRVVLFRIPTNRSQWVDNSSLELIDRTVDEACRNGEHLYFGVGAQAKPTTRGRGEASGVIGIPCLWADVDLATKPDATKRYPDQHQARIAIETMPLRPSFTVLTGGGWHCYWLFNELFECGDAAARDRVARLSMAWQYRLDDILKRQSNTCIDHTHDLARILRLPGSWNPKHDCEVRLHPDSPQNPDDWVRYDFDFVESLMPESKDVSPLRGGMTHVCGNLTLSADMRPSSEYFDALMQNSDEFAAVMEHRRQMPSCSEYEMSLASHADKAGWPDQEIAALLVYHRMKYEPAKIGKLLDRPGYLTSTIARARDTSSTQDAIDQLEVLIERPDRQAVATVTNPASGEVTLSDVPAPTADPGNEVRDQVLNDVSKLLKIRISGFTQIGRQDPHYSITLADGRRIPLGQFDLAADGQRVFTRRILEETHEVITGLDRKKWFTVLRALLKIVTVEESDELRVESSVLCMLRRYVESRAVPESEWQNVAALGEPFIKGGQLYVSLNKTVDYIGRYGANDKLKKGTIEYALRDIGFARETVYCKREDGKRTSISYMAIDLELWNSALGVSA